MNVAAYLHVLLTLSSRIFIDANNRYRDGRCEDKLLDDKQRVPDIAFTESSAFEDQYRGYAARESFDKDQELFAWCPRQAVGKDMQEFIAIDLGSLRIITHIWTKGRTARGTGSESTQYYYLQYKREAGEMRWRTYKHSDLAIGERLRGNVDPTVESIAEMSPKIIARYIKIVPYNEEPARPVCMKLQIYGCDFEEPYVEYRAPIGHESELSMLSQLHTSHDITYDGKTISNPYLGVANSYPTYTDGLGILSDGLIPVSVSPNSEESYREHLNSLLPSQNIGSGKSNGLSSRGSAFITWFQGQTNEKGPYQYVDIVFRFLGIYNVTRFHLFVANGGASLSQTRLPLAVEFWMGLDNIAVYPCWLQSPSAPTPFSPDAYVTIPKDSRNISPRWLDFQVALGRGAAGNFSRIRLHFSNESDTGIAVSEVSFTATPTSLLAVTFKESGKLDASRLPSSKLSTSISSKHETDGKSGAEDITANLNPTSSTPSREKKLDVHILVIVACAVVVCGAGIFLFITFGCWHCLRRQHHRKKCHHPAAINNVAAASSCTNGYFPHQHFSQGSITAGYNFQTAPQQQPLITSGCAVNYYPTLSASTTSPRLPFPSPELVPLDPNHKQSFAFFSQMANSTNALCLPFHVSTANPSYSATSGQYADSQSQKTRSGTMMGVDNGSLYNSLKTCHTSGGDCNGSDTESGGYHYARGSPHFTEPGMLSYTPHGILSTTPAYQNNNTVNLSTSHCDQQLSPSLNHLLSNPLSSVADFTTLQATRYTSGATPPLIPTAALCNPMGTLPMPPLSERLPNISIQGVSGSSVYSLMNESNNPFHDEALTPSSLENLNLPMISPDDLETTTLLHAGDYSQIHLASLRIPKNGLDDNKGPNQSVIVKTLSQSASPKLLAEFVKEIRHLSRLRHHNLSQIVGVSKYKGDNIATRVLLESSSYGDLHQFLQRHSAKEEELHPPATRTLSHGTLIYFATQIASGMKYLEQIELVHRDLACRNCLVGDRYFIKITDIAMCQRQYHADYYYPPGGQPSSPLPIRWMACESVLQNIFSSKSDVWSFGVTLFEILTFSRDRPYTHLSDEKVLDNLRFLRANDPRGETLVPPPRCPRELSDLMKQCWSRQCTVRPNFHEIHMFLQRKNQGYVPSEITLESEDMEECIDNNGVESSASLLKHIFINH